KALAETRTATFNPFQSLPYASPERAETARVDHHSDLWAVTVMLYEMVAGQRPFHGQGEELRDRIIQCVPDPLSPSVPEPLRNIIFKALARELPKRYASAAELIGDLARFLNGQPVLAPAPDDEATRRTSPSGAPNGPSPTTDPEATRRTAPG